MAVSAPADTQPSLYDPVEEVETPAVLVDLGVMERTLEEVRSVQGRGRVR